MPLPIALAGQTTTDIVGVPGTLVGPVGVVIPFAKTVRAGKAGLPVATVAADITIHGNPDNPKAPGFNSLCGHARIATTSVSTVYVEGVPIAPITSVCTCGHYVLFDGDPTILIGP
jgi:uncharacterized Zn-binding protein involved in type VI secretion